MSKARDDDFVTIDDLPENEQIALRAAMDGTPILTLPAEFDLFDPIKAEAPYELQNVTRRARELLTDADQDLIRAAVTFAEIATTIALVEFESLERPITDEEKRACSGALDELRPTTLFRRLRLIDDLGFKPKELPWYVVFASLSLAYVARSVNNGVNHGIEAADALAKAEVLFNKSRAGKIKPVANHFKHLLEEYIQANPGLSGSEYARRFIPLHSREMRNLHGPEYDDRTVANWARAILKAQKPTQ